MIGQCLQVRLPRKGAERRGRERRYDWERKKVREVIGVTPLCYNVVPTMKVPGVERVEGGECARWKPHKPPRGSGIHGGSNADWGHEKVSSHQVLWPRKLRVHVQHLAILNTKMRDRERQCVCVCVCVQLVSLTVTPPQA